MTESADTAGEKRSLEGRCDGLSVQFQAAKVVSACDKHVSMSSTNSRQQHPAAGQLQSADTVDPGSVLPQSDEAHIQMPGARRSLAGHHDKHSKKHSKKGKHQDSDAEDEDKDRDHNDRHHEQHSKKHVKHSDRHAHGKHCHMTFEDAEGKPFIVLFLYCWFDKSLQVSIIGT